VSEEKGRRQFLEVAAVGASATAAGLAAWPLGAAIVDTGSGASEDAPYLDLAADADVREGAPLKAFARAERRDGWSVEPRDLGAVWLVRERGRVRAFSAVCPHLGCLVDKDAPGGFHCPCHNSRFAADGAVQSGPSPRALDELAVRVESGRLLVQVVQFAPGTRERKSV
jgi:Rieske Fe-S protein